MSQSIPLVSFLDPRPAAEAASMSYADSANIPAAEIAARVAELPRKDEMIRVIGPEPYRGQALSVLAGMGREAVPVNPDATTVNQKSKVKNQEVPGRLWHPNELLEEFIAGIEPGTALDLACGTGRDAIYLASLGWEVTGVDVLPDAIERAEELAKRYLPATGRQEHYCENENGEGKCEAVECGSLLLPKIRQLAAEIADCDGSKLPRSEQEQAPALHSFASPRLDPPQSKIENRKLRFVSFDLTKTLPNRTYDLVTCFFYFNQNLLANLHTLLNPQGIALIELFTDEDKAKHGKPKKTVNPKDLAQLLQNLQITKQEEGWHHGRHTVRVIASVR